MIIEELKNDLPLTAQKLDKWLVRLAEGMSYQLPTATLETIYDTAENTIISCPCFDDLFEAIKSNRAITSTLNGQNVTVVNSSYTEYTEDDYRAIEFTIFTESSGNLQYVRFGIENLGGSIRLYGKSIKAV